MELNGMGAGNMTDHLSNNHMKLVKSLQQKKYRDEHGLFLVEGVKLVNEAIHSQAKLEMIVYACEEDELPFTLPLNSYRVSPKELGRMSGLKTPNRVLAVCHKDLPTKENFVGWIVALDQISDPGNLGTIIRICDWMGVDQIVCAQESVDVFNTKVVQASMGSIFRVEVIYESLEEYLEESNLETILEADMEGQSIYEYEPSVEGILVMGSESHGLRPEISAKCTGKISIPQFGGGESLNVAVSTGIILSHLRKGRSL
ncbi:MAG TPA: RNA methyltransferase [Cryomorphaceae bacterium]|nr:RNA methyltransferase [Cryomorphaceae bacterium]